MTAWSILGYLIMKQLQQCIIEYVHLIVVQQILQHMMVSGDYSIHVS